jgi:SAM-dependent methyltransferase
VAAWIGGRIPDFLPAAGAAAGSLLELPPAFLDRAEAWLRALEAGTAVGPAAAAELEARGLAGPGPRLTPLGAKLAYHLAETRCQAEGDWIAGALGGAPPGPAARVLDVGCGAGQTLRLLGPGSPGARVGVDVDAEALALGRLLADGRASAPAFVRASAHALPFADGHFSYVLCRVALNYMHQRRALAEMARVLAPGGRLYLHAEGPGYDLRLLAAARRPAQLAGGLRDLLWGTGLALLGRQPAPGRRATGGRAFATARRAARVLGRAGCAAAPARVTARHLGLPAGFELLAEKCPR